MTQPRHRTLKVVAFIEDDDFLGHISTEEKFVDLKFICASILVLNGKVKICVS